MSSRFEQGAAIVEMMRVLGLKGGLGSSERCICARIRSLAASKPQAWILGRGPYKKTRMFGAANIVLDKMHTANLLVWFDSVNLSEAFDRID